MGRLLHGRYGRGTREAEAATHDDLHLIAHTASISVCPPRRIRLETAGARL